MFEDGRWVTIGGRRIFIQKGQSLPDAMKKSGKFKLTKEQKEAGVEVKDSDFEKNFKDMDEDELKEHLNKLESGMDDFDEDEPQYKELQKEYNEVKKQLDSRSKKSESKSEKSYTQKDLDNAKAKMLEMEGTLDDFDSDDDLRGSKEHKQAKKEYNDAKAEYDKISESLRNTSSNKTAKNQAIADRIMGKKDVSMMSELELENTYKNLKSDDKSKYAEQVRGAYEVHQEAKASGGRIISGNKKDDDFESVSKQLKEISSRTGRSDQSQYSQKELDNVWKKEDATEVYNTLTNTEKNKLARAHDDADNFNNQSAKDYIKKMDNEAAKRYLDQQNSSGSNNNYAEYYKKENLGKPSNYQKGDKIEFSDGYYSILKGSIVREATDKEKKYQINSNLKGYVVRDTNGNEHIVADTRIRNVGGTQAYKSAYEDYKKKHPNSKLSFNQFVDMSEGK